MIPYIEHSFDAEPESAQSSAARIFVDKIAAKPLKNTRVVNLKCGADIVPKPIRWLWRGWLPAGKLTILAGAAGTGKTTLALGLAAALTSTGKWPDETVSEYIGNVLIWSGEDNAEDTLVPRLIASGANMNYCHFINGIIENGENIPFDPARDMLELHLAVARINGASLLIVDPIVSAVSGDMHKANDVRRSLQALVDFAGIHECAVLGISHFSKGSAGRSPQERVIGSQAFGALARMVLVAAKEEDGNRRVLARAKSNIAPDDGGIAYSLEQIEMGDIETTRVVWEGMIEGSARNIIGDIEHDESEIGNLKADAEQFLIDLLSSGPLSAKQISADAHGAGYSAATIRRAKQSLGIEAIKGGMKDGWKWSLPTSFQRRRSSSI